METRDAWLTGEPSKAEINSELGQTFLLFGEVAEAGHNLADAASWFVRAHDKGDDKAAGKLVLVLIREPALAEALPVEFSTGVRQSQNSNRWKLHGLAIC